MDIRPSCFQILIIESLLGLMPDQSIFYDIVNWY